MKEDETKNTTTSAAELPIAARSILHEQSRKLSPIDDDATRNASSNNKEPPAVLGGEKMVLLQEAIDEVNSRSFGSHAVLRHQQVTNEEMVASDEEIKNYSTSSVHLDAIQHTSGNKRKRRAPIQSFDERFNDLMSFKAKYGGHCDVPQNGENASLGKWCSRLRGFYKEMQNKQKLNTKLADEQIQRLNDAGFKWSLRKANSGFDDRFNDLIAYKATYGHCDVHGIGENASLGTWCSGLRYSYKKIQNNQMPRIKLSDEQIQRLNDAGFKWSVGKFEEQFKDLMSFKAKHGHCDVPQNGENASLGKWCSRLRGFYKEMQNKQKLNTKLADEQIQRLNDAGFKWSLRKANSGFDDRFNDLIAYKATYGHCDVHGIGENASLGTWCSGLRYSYKKIQNNQMPRIKLSDEQIRRLNDAGFKWSLQGKFEEHFKDLMAFKAKHGHCDVAQNGEDVSLGRWCCEMRVTYKKMKNNQKTNTKLADEQIQRLNDAGFKWSLRKIQIFDVRFNDLMAFKANYDHCNVSQYSDDFSPLGKWCSALRYSYKKIKNNQKPKMKLSDEQIQRLDDVGFTWRSLKG